MLLSTIGILLFHNPTSKNFYVGVTYCGETVEEDNFYYQECYWGAFSRSVILPVDVVVDKADSFLKNGILTIKLPKAKKSKTTKIQVKAK